MGSSVFIVSDGNSRQDDSDGGIDKNDDDCMMVCGLN